MLDTPLRRYAVHAAAFLLLVIVAAPAAAQSRRGFWIGGGIGIASVTASTDEFDLDREAVPAIHLEGGWAVSSRTLVGVRFESFGLEFAETQTGPTHEAVVVDVIGTVTFYPRTGSIWFVHGGAGGTIIDDVDGSDRVLDVSGGGVSVFAGTGYDIPLGRLFALTPAVSYRFGRVGTLRVEGTPLGTWSHHVVAATVSLIFR